MTRDDMVSGLTSLMEVLTQRRDEIVERTNKLMAADKSADEYLKEWNAIKLERESNGSSS